MPHSTGTSYASRPGHKRPKTQGSAKVSKPSQTVSKQRRLDEEKIHKMKMRRT